MTTDPPFEADPAPETQVPGAVGRFVVTLDGYEGPIDVLLALARDQKVDLARLSILQLADQYLAFVAEARRVNLELAADYLVMAAWLAFLKSKLLLPATGTPEEPSGEAMAAALQFQLRRLEAMREAGDRLMARPRLGIDVFGRGAPETFPRHEKTIWEITLFDLLKCYGDHRRRKSERLYRLAPLNVYSVEDAILRFERMLGVAIDWQSIWRFLPDILGGGVQMRSAYAATFAASLELARQGRVVLRQAGPFAPIYVRAADRPRSEVEDS